MTSAGTFQDIPSWWPTDVRETVREALESKRISQIRSALSPVKPILRQDNARIFKLSIARTFTLEPQVDAISLMMATCPCAPEIRLGDLGNIEQALLDPGSALLADSPDAVVVLWRLEDLYPSLVYEACGWSSEKRQAAIESLIHRIKDLCKGYLSSATSPLFLSTFPMPKEVPGVLSDLHTAHGLRSAFLRANLEILNLASTHNQIHVFDFAGWAEEYGVKSFDPKMDFYARQPIASDALISFAEALRRTLEPLIRPSAKVLALDLDGILWGGIIGESDLSSLQIGRDYPGNVYLRIQQAVKSLKMQGVLLVLLSKNNLSDVEQAFAKVPDMILGLHDFAAVRANWNPKHQNLRDVAQELNLGLDSFAFLDDQAFEREEMAHFLPDVQVLPVSEDPLTILQTLTNCRLFNKHRIGEEDLNRNVDYVREQRRKVSAKPGASVEEFLFSLQLQARVSPLEESGVPRAVQMLSKTNQFNVSTHRHSESKVRNFASNPNNVLLTLSMQDRFGDQGIIGLAIALAPAAPASLGDTSGSVPRDPTSLHIDSFLLSCRAIGRGAEQVLWGKLLARASAQGYRELTAEYIPSAKNQQVADLFDRLGMEVVLHDDTRKLYRLSLPASAQIPLWFAAEPIMVHE